MWTTNYNWIKLFWNERKAALYFPYSLLFIQIFIMDISMSAKVERLVEWSSLEVPSPDSKIIHLWPVSFYLYLIYLPPQTTIYFYLNLKYHNSSINISTGTSKRMFYKTPPLNNVITFKKNEYSALLLNYLVNIPAFTFPRFS